ncbi:NADP-specific glutamate dehydrogenase [Endozoicomonas elysicola]|uniref:Glutamate dehydrogenase n=1 Tax=Endozoicomonas elysicola TaxID=305900 RepID=A0A081KFT0_9GAMM|nr:NADP-specific glutamate dehydrogenase [Endozoicomonas elysicola]KEI73006.1 glutamate dehydrogenase [Endozoicomonas elysicola]
MFTKKLELDDFMNGLARRNPNEPEFHQAVREVAESVIPYINHHQKYIDARILERMTEPDRIIIFRVCWEDDDGHIRVNRGYRVQFNNAIGPYKGGLRFTSNLSLDTLKFLGFEQTFKNSLTTLPLGSAKGGADFNPKGKSDREVMRFCQSFMTELHKHIGAHTDVPAGDIGVGAREISYMFGQYKRLQNEFRSVLTGKELAYGGSLIRKEATGYGTVFFTREMLKAHQKELEGKRCIVSGSGNVALYTAQKVMQLGATVIAMSDSGGSFLIPSGMTQEHLNHLIDLKEKQRGRISEFAEHFDCDYYPDKKVWDFPCDIAFACATQNELELNDAKELVKNGCIALAEGANMPTTMEASHYLREAGILFAPAKAANAGGVAVSGLEMSQNSMRLSWPLEELEKRLEDIMFKIHQQSKRYGQQSDNTIDYIRGANIAGFTKVADAMLSYGFV